MREGMPISTVVSCPTAESISQFMRFFGLTRIRPNNCAFKGVFFGSSPIELDSDTVKIAGHDQDFTWCGETEQPKTARSGCRPVRWALILHSRFPKAR